MSRTSTTLVRTAPVLALAVAAMAALPTAAQASAAAAGAAAGQGTGTIEVAYDGACNDLPTSEPLEVVLTSRDGADLSTLAGYPFEGRVLFGGTAGMTLPAGEYSLEVSGGNGSAARGGYTWVTVGAGQVEPVSATWLCGPLPSPATDVSVSVGEGDLLSYVTAVNVGCSQWPGQPQVSLRGQTANGEQVFLPGRTLAQDETVMFTVHGGSYEVVAEIDGVQMELPVRVDVAQDDEDLVYVDGSCEGVDPDDVTASAAPVPAAPAAAAPAVAAPAVAVPAKAAAVPAPAVTTKPVTAAATVTKVPTRVETGLAAQDTSGSGSPVLTAVAVAAGLALAGTGGALVARRRSPGAL